MHPFEIEQRIAPIKDDRPIDSFDFATMLFSRNELKPLLNQVSSNDPGLTSIHLSHKKITNKQLVQISDALRDNSNVTEIWLTNNQISDDGTTGGAGAVGYLMGVLEGNGTVGEVYLGGNKIGAKGASSIANLLQSNNVITDIGLEDNVICDGGAKMLADALAHNTKLQTLKLQGNNIQTEATLKAINDKLKKNRDEAKKRFELEHPELATHKLKKPPPKEKKSKKKSGSRSRDEERKHRGKDGSESRSGRPSSSSKGGSGSRKLASSSTAANNFENYDAFLEERKMSTEESKPGLKDKFRGLGLGGGGSKEKDGMRKDGTKDAAFV